MKNAAAIPPDVQCRAFIHERLGFIIAGAEIAQRYTEIGDDVGLEYQLRRLVLHLRAATATFKELAAAENAKREAA